MACKCKRLRFETLESRQVLSGTVAAAATVFVHIPDNLTGRPGATVIAPVDIDSAAGIRGAEIHINYDTTRLDATEASVRADLPGTVWPTATQVVANVDDVNGTIVAFVFTAAPLTTGAGSLLRVQFAIKGTAPVDGASVIDLAQVRLNEGAIVPSPQPQPWPVLPIPPGTDHLGTDTTDGLVTFVGAGQTASVSGYVYADTNGNHRRDPVEGVPRVKIVLVSADNTTRRQTFTGDDGRYDFRDLPAGSYSIREQQPVAYVDGGPNVRSVRLTLGQSLVNQNFRELGLRPQYVYNRLFTTLVMPVGSTNWVSALRRIVSAGEAAVSGAQVAAAYKTAAAATKKLAVAAARPAVSSAGSVSYVAAVAPQPKRLAALDRVLTGPVQWLLGY